MHVPAGVHACAACKPSTQLQQQPDPPAPVCRAVCVCVNSRIARRHGTLQSSSCVFLSAPASPALPLLQMVCQATTAQDVRIRIGAFSCLHEIAAGYYGKLPPYMPEIFNISVKAINGDEEDVALQVCLGLAVLGRRQTERHNGRRRHCVCLPLASCTSHSRQPP